MDLYLEKFIENFMDNKGAKLNKAINQQIQERVAPIIKRIESGEGEPAFVDLVHAVADEVHTGNNAFALALLSAYHHFLLDNFEVKRRFKVYQ